ncbi:hypothetical protein [Shinella sp.]|uniref:hypothetical protein n=1 Tax=Shinella sp. TaxID=1870904 RepID=UPI0025909F18|nr:hypothetical protein [Shinella sp.]MCW5706923.1 hypothetical protein [Shinella sp.]
MANNEYEATGVLILDKVTPVITALFGGYNLDATYPGEGRAYIASTIESGDPYWDLVHESLVDLAGDLGILPQDDAAPSIEAVLRLLARHFHLKDHDELDHFIEHQDFGGLADLDALFLIATWFDDGHNLKAIAFEGCWYCSKPRLFEFGGNGYFISRPITHFANSSEVITLGEQLMQALLDNNLEAAGVLIANQTIQLLAGIEDSSTRTTLRKLVAEHLAQLPSPAP